MRHVTLFVFAALAVLMISAPAAPAATLRAHVSTPIVIGDQLFSGGLVEVVDAPRFDRVRISIDGVPVAICARHTYGTIPSGATPYLLFERDERGFRHLIGIRFALKESDDPATATRELRPMLVTAGLATVPAVPLRSPVEAMASAR
jgi:hypothetical protein